MVMKLIVANDRGWYNFEVQMRDIGRDNNDSLWGDYKLLCVSHIDERIKCREPVQ
jgi:hypothetical protein